MDSFPMTGWCRPDDVNGRVNAKGRDSIASSIDCEAECLSVGTDCVGYAYADQDGTQYAGRCYIYGAGVDAGLPSGTLNGFEWHGVPQSQATIGGASVCMTRHDPSDGCYARGSYARNRREFNG